MKKNKTHEPTSLWFIKMARGPRRNPSFFKVLIGDFTNKLVSSHRRLCLFSLLSNYIFSTIRTGKMNKFCHRDYDMGFSSFLSYLHCCFQGWSHLVLGSAANTTRFYEEIPEDDVQQCRPENCYWGVLDGERETGRFVLLFQERLEEIRERSAPGGRGFSGFLVPWRFNIPSCGI